MARIPKKEEIYSEAARLFQEKGYSAASMRDLADRVNLKASSLYSHIRKKEEILQKICFDNAQRFLGGMDQIEAAFVTPRSRLEALIALHIDVALDDPTSITVFNDEWRHLEEPYLTDFMQLRKGYENRFRAVIEEGVEKGVFRKIHPHTALNTILNALQWVHYQKTKEQAKDLHQDITNLLMGGLEA